MFKAPDQPTPDPSATKSYDLGLDTARQWLQQPTKHGSLSRLLSNGSEQISYIVWGGTTLDGEQYAAVATDGQGRLLRRRLASDGLLRRPSQEQRRKMPRQQLQSLQLEDQLVAAIGIERSKHGCDPDGTRYCSQTIGAVSNASRFCAGLTLPKAV